MKNQFSTISGFYLVVIEKRITKDTWNFHQEFILAFSINDFQNNDLFLNI